jgi:hypothetical protein
LYCPLLSNGKPYERRYGRLAYLRVRRLAFLAVRLPLAFFGTFAPAALASESPIAIACFRLLTLRPERPLFNVPALRFFIARSTVLDAFLEYFRALRAMIFSPSNAPDSEVRRICGAPFRTSESMGH